MPDRGPILAGENDPSRPRVVAAGGRLLSAVIEAVWAMEPSVLGRFYQVVMRHDLGVKVAPEVVAEIVAGRGAGPGTGAMNENGYAMAGSVAVIPIGGVIAKHANQVNGSSQPRGTSTESVRRAFAAAQADRAVSSILLHVESPGGYIGGVETLAAEIFAARETGKPTWTFFDDIGASAAYWIGSQASRVLAGPVADVGSIGVYMVIPDTSRAYEEEGIHMNLVKYGKGKGAGVDGVPVDAAALDKFQQRVNDIGDAFVAAVVRGRGMSRESATSLATGDTWTGSKLVATGLVDDLARSAEAVAAEMDKRFGSKAEGGKGRAEASGTQNQAPAIAAAASAGNPAEGNVKIGIGAMAAGLALLAAAGTDVGAGGGGVATEPDKAVIERTRMEAIAAENKRVNAIRSLAARHAGNAEIQKLADEAIKDPNRTVEAFGLAAAEKLAPPPTGHVAGGGSANAAGVGVEVGQEEQDKLRGALELMLLEKTAPEVNAALSAGGDRGSRMAEVLGFATAPDAIRAMQQMRASGLKTMRLLDVAEEFVMRRHGLSHRRQLATRFPGVEFFGAAFNSSSDFPLLLSNYAQKRLMAAYQEVATHWQEFCTVGQASDFKDQRVLGISEAPNFELVITGMTPAEATFNERQNTLAVDIYAKRGSFDFKALRNDDLSAFTRMGQMFGQAAKRVPEDLFFTLLQQNSGLGPTLGAVTGAQAADTIAAATMIHATHNNVGTSGALSDTTIDDAWQKAKQQRGFGKDKAYMEVMLDRVLVPTNLEMTASRWYKNDVKPGGTNNEANMVQGRLRPVSSPRLTSTTRWWAFANPAIMPCFQMNFLDGVQTPQFTQINDGDPLNWRFQYTLMGVGVAGIDWFGVVGNAGT
jgi:signal peptide peptidase SppA